MQVAGPGWAVPSWPWSRRRTRSWSTRSRFLVSALCLHRMDPDAARPAGPAAPARSRCGARSPRASGSSRATATCGTSSCRAASATSRSPGTARCSSSTPCATWASTRGAVGIVMQPGSAGGLVGAAVATRATAGAGRGPGDGGPAGARPAHPPCSCRGRPGWSVVLVPVGMALVGLGVVGANVIRGAFRMRYVPGQLLGRTTSAAVARRLRHHAPRRAGRGLARGAARRARDDRA